MNKFRILKDSWYYHDLILIWGYLKTLMVIAENHYLISIKICESEYEVVPPLFVGDLFQDPQ